MHIFQPITGQQDCRAVIGYKCEQFFWGPWISNSPFNLNTRHEIAIPNSSNIKSESCVAFWLLQTDHKRHSRQMQKKMTFKIVLVLSLTEHAILESEISMKSHLNICINPFYNHKILQSLFLIYHYWAYLYIFRKIIGDKYSNATAKRIWTSLFVSCVRLSMQK